MRTVILGAVLCCLGGGAMADGLNCPSPNDCASGKMFLSCPPDCQPFRGITYTPDEIDRMREAVYKMIAASVCVGPNACPTIPDAVVEDRLRTYIAAGISPEALEERARCPSPVTPEKCGLK